MDYRQELKEKYKIERQNYEMNIHGDTSKYKIEIEDIIKEHWDFLFVKPKAIYVRIVKSENKTENKLFNIIIIYLNIV